MTSPGGNAAVGTISASGVYSAPSAMPAAGTVTIKAVSAADSSATATTLTLWNPLPTLSSVSPQSFATGAFTLTINGSNFVNGAQVLFAGAAINTSFVSATKLTATGTASTAGTISVAVQNPNPGASTSNAINVQVTSNAPPPPPPPPPPSACSVMTPGQGGSLNGFIPFQADNLWNKDIPSAPIDPNSTALNQFHRRVGNNPSRLRLRPLSGLKHRHSVRRRRFDAAICPDQLHRLWRRKRPGPDACAGQCSN